MLHVVVNWIVHLVLAAPSLDVGVPQWQR